MKLATKQARPGAPAENTQEVVELISQQQKASDRVQVLLHHFIHLPEMNV